VRLSFAVLMNLYASRAGVFSNAEDALTNPNRARVACLAVCFDRY